jgi:general secretion pathway protein L
VLRKELVLPLAAEANLAQVLGFELGRHTPFAADQAYYDGRVVREDRAGQRLHVQLTATVKSRVDELLGRLLEWGVTPHYIGVADELLGKGDCVNLLPVHLRPKRSNLDYWLYAGMAGVTLLLLATILLTPLWQKRELVIAIQPILAKAQQQADAVDALKREQDRLLAEYNFPLERKLTTPPRVAVLEEVTRILPDDTWLQQLDIQGGGVTMQGITSASSRLIGLLEKSATLENASFKSPLVKVQPGEERFQLAASLKAIPLADALAFQRALAEGKKAKGKSKAEAKPIDAKAKPNPLPGGKP